MMLHRQQISARMAGKARVSLFMRQISSSRLDSTHQLPMKANLFRVAVAHTIRWKAVRAIVSLISKRCFSLKPAVKISETAKTDNLPLAGVKVLDMTRVLAGVIRIYPPICRSKLTGFTTAVLHTDLERSWVSQR